VNNSLFLFVLLIVSWLACIVLYIAQKRINEAKQRENFLILYHEFKASGKNDILAEDITKTEETLTREFKNLQKKITGALGKNDLDKANLLADKYMQIVNAIAKKKENKLTSDLNTDSITLSNILKLHGYLFPKNYELAGKIRTVRVYIEGKKQQPARLLPPPADKVRYLLKNILLWWRGKSKQLQNSSEEDKIDAITQFHHQFLVIHPFLDGNGRLARLLLKLQLKEQFQKDIDVKFNKADYYRALSRADQRDKTELHQLIANLLNNKSVFN
jgi:Fic family protein